MSLGNFDFITDLTAWNSKLCPSQIFTKLRITAQKHINIITYVSQRYCNKHTFFSTQSFRVMYLESEMYMHIEQKLKW